MTLQRKRRTREECEALALRCYRNLSEWALSDRQRRLAWEIVNLTFGRGREFVDVYGNLLSRLTLIDTGDVTRTLNELSELGVVHVLASRRPQRIYFLPEAELITPETSISQTERAAVLAKIETLQPAAETEDRKGQQFLALETVDEALAADQRQASADLALERELARLRAELDQVRKERDELARKRPAAPFRRPSEKPAAAARQTRAEAIRPEQLEREKIEAAMRARGMAEDSIEASRVVPVDRLRESLVSLHPDLSTQIGAGTNLTANDTPLRPQIGETPILAENPAANRPAGQEISGSRLDWCATNLNRGTEEPKTQIGEGTNLAAAPSVASAQIGEPPIWPTVITVNRRDLSLQSAVIDCGADAPVSEWVPPSVADPELMRLLRDLVGSSWNRKAPDGRGNWGALWSTTLRSSPVACVSALEAVQVTRDKLERGEIRTTVGRCLWGTFKIIHARRLEEHKAKTAAVQK